MKGNLQNAPSPLPPVVYVRQGVVGSIVDTVVVAGSQDVAEEKVALISFHCILQKNEILVPESPFKTWK